MKTNTIILSVALLGLTLSSCTDLDVDIDSQYTQMPGTEAAVNANMNDLFIKFRGTLGRRYMEATCLSSDEYTSLSYSGNWVDGYTYAHSAYHNYNYEDAVLDWMENLGKANVLASEIANSSYPEQNRYEARVMRAFHTFLEMDMWGDVPIADGDYVTEHGLDPNNRHPRAEVAKYIEKELLEIIAADKLIGRLITISLKAIVHHHLLRFAIDNRLFLYLQLINFQQRVIVLQSKILTLGVWRTTVNKVLCCYVNNLFNSRPLDPSEISKGSYTELNNPMYFGFEIKLKI